jgi:deoxyribonuclease (pyrimidine dimer)
MTRINCVPPSELHNKHLVAEYYELPRVFTYVRKAVENGKDITAIKAPNEYTLGTGHVKFFYTRLGWCVERMAELTIEMKVRGMKPKADLTGLAAGLPANLLGSWQPTPEAMKINRERLAEREKSIKSKAKRPVPSHKD